MPLTFRLITWAGRSYVDSRVRKATTCLSALLCMSLGLGCERAEPTPSPLLQIVDSVCLAQTDSQFIGLPLDLTP